MSRFSPDPWLFLVAVTLLTAGAVAWSVDLVAWEVSFWVAGTLVGVVLATTWMVKSLRSGRVGVDIIAVLALIGALIVGEPFAGAMITVMLVTGRLLESRASSRARRDLSLLVQRAPRVARRVGDSGITEIPIGEVVCDDELLVGPGEVVPVDGRLLVDAVLDESSLTGEALPVGRRAGESVRSGSVNAGSAMRISATADATSSTYSQIVRLVEQAQASTAPFVRSADRIAAVFVPFSLLLAAVAWLINGDPTAAVAVLVVATPCPLILAAPISIMSGLSRAARSGVVVKGGDALERLAAGRILLLDKTGTVTRGRPAVTEVVPVREGSDGHELLRLAASLDQVSPHVLAGAIVTAARTRQLRLSMPEHVLERPGYGIEGVVDGHLVRIGKVAWIAETPPPAWLDQVRRRAAVNSQVTVFVAVDGEPAAVFLIEDPVRPDARRMIRTLRAAGITRTVLLTGDRSDVAETVGRLVGVDSVFSDADPAAKVARVLAESQNGPTIMVGDGVNDAPALAAAGVGVALAAAGATASSEAADVVLTVDRIDRLADAILIARRSKRIALQAAVVGMGLSVVAMIAAAWGYLPPAVGALLQELIDVLAILVALRAVLPGRSHALTMDATDAALTSRVLREHVAVLPVVERIPVLAGALAATPESLAQIRLLLHILEAELLPHEHREQDELFPVMDTLMGGADVTAGLSRAHTEIDLQVDRLRRILAGVEGDTLSESDLPQLRQVLYGLYGVLRLHNAQEEETIFSLLPAQDRSTTATRERSNPAAS